MVPRKGVRPLTVTPPPSLSLSFSLLSLSPFVMPLACTVCSRGTSGGSRACLRVPLMCAQCCRNNGGCARHVQQSQPAQQVPLAQPLPPVQLLPLAQPVVDPAAPALSQLTTLLQQLTALLPALAAAAPHPPPPASLVLLPVPPQPPAQPLAQLPLPPQLPASSAVVNGQQVGVVLGLGGMPPPPLPPALWPPPPPAPASHLAAYPPPIGSVGPSQLLSQAQSSAQVSPQHIQHSAAAPTQLLLGSGVLQASGSGQVDVRLHHTGQFANTYPCDPSTAGTRLSRMPMGLLPVTPERTGKPPKSAEELQEVLTHWLRNEPELQRDGHRQAFEDYVAKTVLLAKDYGISLGLNYHAEVVKALLHQPFPLYDPYLHGPVFQTAHLSLVMGKSKLGVATRSSFRRGNGGSKSTAAPPQTPVGSKRKAASSAAASTSPQAECSIPGHVGHTNADCRWQQQQKQLKAKKAKGSAPATTPAPAAASDSD